MNHISTNCRLCLLCGFALGAAFCAAIVSCATRETPVQDAIDSSAETADGPMPIDEFNSAIAGGLIGSKHDFSLGDGRWKDLCTPCHTPHDPMIPPDGPGTAGRLRFVSYDSIGTPLDRSTVLCLSCHDGVTAQDVFSGAHALSWATPVGTSFLPVSGRTSHPIGVRMPMSDPTYRSAAEVQSSGAIRLPDGRVQCVSCHDPHNTDRHPGMLVQNNRGSRLCLACHRI